MCTSLEMPKVLFVDDEVSILKAFRLNLGRSLNLHTAKSGRDALQLVEEEGPFEVIVSDFSMPGMNGDQFLEKVREQDKEVVTILLTGQANFDDVCEVVRRGKIFRLLAKPCTPNNLAKNIEDALRQHRLIKSEKELLEQTLNGTLDALSSLLAASKPKIFRRAERVEALAKETARQMKLPGGWRLGIAAKFSYLGYLTIPDEFQEKAYWGEQVPENLKVIIDGIPEFVSGLLKDIPRLDRVRKIIELVGQNYESLEGRASEEDDLASIIHLCRDFDAWEEQGYSKSEIFEHLRLQENNYLPGSLDALASTRDLEGGMGDSKRVKLIDLVPGNRILEDIELPDGKMLAQAGTRVSLAFVQTLKSYSESGSVVKLQIDVAAVC